MSDNKITLTYLNIRQSIAVLLAKLIIIDIILATVIFFIYYALIQGDRFILGLTENDLIFLIIFGVVGIIKISITIYVVLQWLFEYYEITPEFVAHKHGIIFRKEEHYRLDTIRGMQIDDSIIGQSFNFATITLYDVFLNKCLSMYLIHNAKRYGKIFKQLQPRIEIKEDKVWVPMHEDNSVASAEENS